MIRKFFELWPRNFIYWLAVAAPFSFLAVSQVVVLHELTDRAIYFSPEFVAERATHISIAAIATLLIAMLLYGTHRVISFHPYFDEDYRSWLAATPYDTTQPLPLGPVELDWRDAVFVVLFSLLFFLSPYLDVLTGAATFLGGYLAITAICLLKGRQYFVTWIVCFGLAIVVGFWSWSLPVFVVELLLFALSRRSLVRTLDPTSVDESLPSQQTLNSVRLLLACGFPSSGPYASARQANPNMGAGGNRNTGRTIFGGDPDTIGWPLAALAPHNTPRSSLGRIAAAVSSLMFAWTLAVLLLLPSAEDIESQAAGVGVLLLYSFICTIVRLLAYCGMLRSPITPFGRIATGRLIIPKYDHVFVTPLIAPFMGPLVYSVLTLIGFSFNIALATAFGITLYVYLMGGPTVRKWTLTGHHRVGTPWAVSSLLRRI